MRIGGFRDGAAGSAIVPIFSIFCAKCAQKKSTLLIDNILGYAILVQNLCRKLFSTVLSLVWVGSRGQQHDASRDADHGDGQSQFSHQRQPTS